MTKLINRRLAVAILLAGMGGASHAKTRPSVFDFEWAGVDNEPLLLSAFKGRALLIVNTASQCAFTGQYAGLQKLWTRYRDRGLTIIGVPSNDFGGQEPGENTDIMGFCSSTYGVTFPLAAKRSVRGREADPLYQWAIAQNPKAEPRWNFHKLLFNRSGHLARTFGSSVEPLDAQISVAIELVLAGA
jgi:glutathione peroxidase